MVKYMWVIEMINKNENLRNNIQIVDLEGLVPKDVRGIESLRATRKNAKAVHIYINARKARTIKK